MSVWMEMYEEADRVIKRYRAGKFTKPEDFQAEGAILNLKYKIARAEAHFTSMASKSGNGLLKKALLSKRLLANEGTAMGATLALPESEEKIKCPGQSEKIITRSQCLDHSGRKENLDDCKGCDLYKINRDLVLGPPQYVA